MKTQVLAQDIAAVTVGAANTEMTTPFVEGRECLVLFECNAFVGTVKLQSSQDNVVWTDEISKVLAAATDMAAMEQITLQRYMRSNITVRTAGSVSLKLIAGND